MPVIVFFSLLSFLLTIAVVFFLLRNWNHALQRDTKFSVLGLLVLMLFHCFSNILEWSGITSAIDPFEDLLEAFMVMWWAFAFYAFIQSITRNDLLKSEKHVREQYAELKQVETALQESEERYRSVFESAGTAMAIVEADMTISKVNSEIEKLTGYSKEELEGKAKWTTFIDKEDLEKMKRYHQERREKKDGVPTAYEFHVIDKFGNKKNILLKVAMIPGTQKSVSSLTDFTLIKRTEEALRESEEKYRQLFEMESDAIFLVDNTSGSILEVNPAASDLYGYSREQFLQMNHTQVSEEPDKTRQAAVSHHSNVPIRYHRKKDGTVFPVEITACHFNWQGRDVHVAAIRDISFRIQAEEEKKKLELQFQQAQKMEAIGTLAGGIAHDFNNLLMGIQGRTSLMLMNTDTTNSHFDHLKGIEEYVQSASDLTKQLLGLARGGKYEVKPTDLNELLIQSVDMFGRTKKEITIHTKCQDDIWIVEVDQGQLQQVFLNLYVNAWQAMPAGGEMYLQTENIFLDKHYSEPQGVEPGRFVKISVTDTGEGMDEGILERIFDPFFTTKEIGRGTGLGLASSYGIIRNHGGIISAESKKGIGTTFSIFLPATTKSIPQKIAMSESMLKGRETILLVDDEGMIIEVGAQMLMVLGYDVLSANGGKEAMKIFKEKQDMIDLVILDMVMPDIFGGDVFDEIKRLNPDAKVLLSSGYSMNEQAIKILERGCNGFINKPFRIEELSHKLREVLDN